MPKQLSINRVNLVQR